MHHSCLATLCRLQRWVVRLKLALSNTPHHGVWELAMLTQVIARHLCVLLQLSELVC